MITVFGSINIDLVTRVGHLPRPGETVAGEDYHLIAGGKGANQALAAARAGARVRMIGCVGRDVFAAPALAGLRDAGVDLDGVTATNAPTGLAAITIDEAGENTIALAGGANRRVGADLIAGVAFSPADTLLVQMEVDRAATLAAARQAHAAGARVMLSLAPFTLLAPGDLAAVDVVLVNETEAAELAHHCGVMLDDEVARAAALAQVLGVTLVATLGPRGALAAAPDRSVVSVPALPVRPVDTTAAGDTFAGVLAAGLDEGLGFEVALRRAAVAGSLACLTLGAQTSMPTRAAIEAALAGTGSASG